ncbi:MAG TPA: TadE/TadG family type IV pilus assembly protein [Rhizomicrobium sp.]|nr:TadE/TadG family type IV pilus assembly protein [Rhizomicrobium sp.]
MEQIAGPRQRARLNRRRARASMEALGDCDGASAVEFVLVLPFLLLALFGIIKFGIVLNNDLELSDGTRASARIIAISRSSSSPWTDAMSAFRASTPNLNQSTTTIKVLVNNVACASDTDCKAALANAAGLPAQINVSYPCDLDIVGIELVKDCKLQSQTTERVE